jgi:hypothetical protein
MSATVAEVNSAKKKVIVPLIIDLGKIRSKKVKELKKGEGPYLEEVLPAINQIKAELHPEIEGKEIMPVIVLYQKKSKKSKSPSLFCL